MFEGKRYQLTRFLSFRLKSLDVGLLVLVLSLALVACGDSSPTPAINSTTPANVATMGAVVTIISAATTIASSATQTTNTIITAAITTNTTATIAPPTTATTQETIPVPTTDTITTPINNVTKVEVTAITPIIIKSIPPTSTSAPTTKTAFSPTSTKIPPLATATMTVVPASSSFQSGKLRGHILAGPVCPVERLDNPCPPRPVVGRAVYVKDQQSGNILHSLTTDANGYFFADLTQGKYLVEVAKQGISSDKSGPHQITIASGQTINLEILVDTGIR